MFDLPGLSFDLGASTDALRKAVRSFAQAEIAPLAVEMDKTNQFCVSTRFAATAMLGMKLSADKKGDRYVLGQVGRGVSVLTSGLDLERAVLSGGPVGIVAAAMAVVLPYVHDRKQFGQSIGEFQLIQGKLRKDYAGAILYSAEKSTWINKYLCGRLWRDSKLYEIGAGTNEIRRMVIGRELFAETTR